MYTDAGFMPIPHHQQLEIIVKVGGGGGMKGLCAEILDTPPISLL